MAVKREFTGECQAQHLNEKLRQRRQQLRQKLQHLCTSLLIKKAEIAYFTKCMCQCVKEDWKYWNIGSVSARKYWKSNNQLKTKSVQLQYVIS